MTLRKRFRFGYKEPPPTLLVIYQGTPVAELEEKERVFVFRYLSTFAAMGLTAIPGLPPGMGELQFAELPKYFAERLPDSRRPEIHRWMVENQAEQLSPLRLLAALSTHTITDPFELRLKEAA